MQFLLHNELSDGCNVVVEVKMLAINHQPVHTKGFYYFGAALITATIILFAIRLHPSFDLGLFQPANHKNPGTVSKNNHDPHQQDTSGAQANAQPESSNQTIPENSFGIANGSGGGNSSSMTVPHLSGASTSAGPTPNSVFNTPITTQPVKTSASGGNSSGSAPSSGEPDGDELPAVGLPSVNVAPVGGLGLPAL